MSTPDENTECTCENDLRQAYAEALADVDGNVIVIACPSAAWGRDQGYDDVHLRRCRHDRYYLIFPDETLRATLE